MEAVVLFFATSLFITIGLVASFWSARIQPRLRSARARFDPRTRARESFRNESVCKSHNIAVEYRADDLFFQYYPAAAENALILLPDSRANHDNEEALAQLITANGLAHVYLPTAPNNSRFPLTTPTDEQAETLDEHVTSLIKFINARSPGAPIYVGGYTSEHEFVVSLFENQSRQVGRVPDLSFFTARDGTRLAYRHYPAQTNAVFIFLHGASTHSGIYAPLAQALSRANRAQVFTPNLRGHFRSGARGGDVDYIGQLEDDLQDLIEEIKKTMPVARIIIGGHSIGGGLAVRFAGGKYGKSADGYVLLAPYLGPLTKTRKDGFANWAKAYRQRALALFLLNAIRIRALNHLTIMKFDSAALANDGADTLHYSYRLFMSMSPRTNVERDLHAISQPLLVLIGEQDELIDRENYALLVASATGQTLRLVPRTRHVAIIYNAQVYALINRWLAQLTADEKTRGLSSQFA